MFTLLKCSLIYEQYILSEQSCQSFFLTTKTLFNNLQSLEHKMKWKNFK